MGQSFAPEDPEGPLYVPQAFEDRYGDEARRTVAESRRRSVRRPRPGKSAWSSLPLEDRLRAALWMVHVFAALLILFFAGLTGTWLVGLSLVLVVAVSLGMSLGTTGPVRARWGDARRVDRGRGSPRRGP